MSDHNIEVNPDDLDSLCPVCKEPENASHRYHRNNELDDTADFISREKLIKEGRKVLKNRREEQIKADNTDGAPRKRRELSSI